MVSSTAHPPWRPAFHLGVISDHVRARLRAAALDRQLARGASPDANPRLALRARALSRPSLSRELGQQLRRIVGEARAPTAARMRVPPCRPRVIEAEDELRLLASRLQSPRRPAVAGLAQVRILLTDGTGPLYHRGSPEGLVAAAREALSALG